MLSVCVVKARSIPREIQHRQFYWAVQHNGMKQESPFCGHVLVVQLLSHVTNICQATILCGLNPILVSMGHEPTYPQEVYSLPILVQAAITDWVG